MADSSPTTATPLNDTESCFYQRTVSLCSWWLIKAKNNFEGKRLAVAGVSSRKDEAMRVFVSAPIVKRYDVFSLETADGKYVIINGFINEQRTLENGFSAEVVIHFLYGFPSNWESCALDCFREESTTGTNLGSAVPHIVSASSPEIISDGVEKSVPTLISPEDVPGDHERLFPENECNCSKEMGVVNVACSSGRRRCSSKLHDIEVLQQKRQPASGGLLQHPDNQNSTSVDLENCDIEGLKSLATPIQPQLQCEFSKDACMESSIPISLVSPEDALRDHEKPFPENENVSNEMGRISFAFSSAGKRRSAGLHDIKKCQLKKQPVSGGLLKHSDNENSTSVDLENCDEEGLRSPTTPIQSQLQRQLSPPPVLQVKKSASTISRTLLQKTKGCYKKKSVTVETKVVRPSGRLNKSASSVKSQHEKDLRHLIKGSQQKISTVSSQSLSFKKSRYGRLLLPPLEFWRNQILIYDANHEITEIQEDASLISPCRGSSPSLKRFNYQKRAG